MGRSAAADALFVKTKEEEESRGVRLALLCTKQQVWVHAGGDKRAVEEATCKMRAQPVRGENPGSSESEASS
eukprot:2371672-Rhodomonas_salina.1